jgi:hypothetical protein
MRDKPLQRLTIRIGRNRSTIQDCYQKRKTTDNADEQTAS